MNIFFPRAGGWRGVCGSSAGKLGFSQKELAFLAGLNRTYIPQIERGVGNPSLQVLLRLAGVLQIKFATPVEGM